MIKKTITYTDYNDVERTEDFYFNLTTAEAAEMELGTKGGLSEALKIASSTDDLKTLSEVFKTVLLKAYGTKSSDGRRFIKTKELSEEFEQTPAYSILYMELATDSEKAAEFFNALTPKV